MAGLFNTRGGLTMVGRCEICNEPVREDANGLCRDCERDTLRATEGDDE